MFEVGLVVAEKQKWKNILPFPPGYRFRIIETNLCKGTLTLVEDGFSSGNSCAGEALDIIHLYFTNMSKREVLRQLRLIGQHPHLFTRLAIVLCEIDAETAFEYQYISSYFQSKCRHRLHIDYFLVLSVVHKSESGERNIVLHSGHEIITTAVEGYYRNMLSVHAAGLALEKKIV